MKEQRGASFQSANGNRQAAIAIACGGTGGHLFPGLAIGEQLLRRGFAVTLLVSPKDVDQMAVRNVFDLRVTTLPAVARTAGNLPAFLRGFWASYRAARKSFRTAPPVAVLAMGGFTSAPPVLAGRGVGATAFLHESNTWPGRANRWLARLVAEAFVGFAETAPRLRARRVSVTGTPVRPQFQPRSAATCRHALGLAGDRPTLLVMGGSQGARAINELFLEALPTLRERAPQLQFIHLTGAADYAGARERHQALRSGAMVEPFSDAMELLMGAATLAVNRAGASSLAELAAMRLPAILIPYPTAADNHQWHNARAYADSGAAWLLEQRALTPTQLADQILALLDNTARLDASRESLANWASPRAAEDIAERVVAALNPRFHPRAETGPMLAPSPQPARS